MMSIDPIQGISLFSVTAAELSASSANISPSSQFSDLVLRKIENVDNTLNISHRLVESYLLGGDVAVHDVMIAMGKARSELQLMVEVRNKLLEAYQEITRIQL